MAKKKKFEYIVSNQDLLIYLEKPEVESIEISKILKKLNKINHIKFFVNNEEVFEII